MGHDTPALPVQSTGNVVAGTETHFSGAIARRRPSSSVRAILERGTNATQRPCFSSHFLWVADVLRVMIPLLRQQKELATIEDVGCRCCSRPPRPYAS